MSPVLKSFQLPRIRDRAALVACCLFKAGLVLGMPMPPIDETAAAGGTVAFSGAVVMGTCAVSAVDAAGGNFESLPTRGECRSGESYAEYRLSAREIGDRPGVRLLQYAKDSYGKAVVLTYVYD